MSITGILNAADAQQLKPVAYTDGSQKLNGLVTSNVGKKFPGVLILPAWKGIDEEAKDAAVALAKEGYIAFIADIYGEGNIPADNAAAAKIAGQYRQDHQAYQRRIALALAQLKSSGADPEKIAVIGYCFGGPVHWKPQEPIFRKRCCIYSQDSHPNRLNGPLHTKILIEKSCRGCE